MEEFEGDEAPTDLAENAFRPPPEDFTQRRRVPEESGAAPPGWVRNAAYRVPLVRRGDVASCLQARAVTAPPNFGWRLLGAVGQGQRGLRVTGAEKRPSGSCVPDNEEFRDRRFRRV